MRIDKTHKPWILATLLAFAAAVILYAIYAATTPNGARGGSAAGLLFGIAGYACMLYAGLLGARKRVSVWRLGRVQVWMRGHLWVGLLSLPLILFHAGFAARGLLTGVLMALLLIVIASGITGALLQHYLPTLMTAEASMETIYDEIPHVRSEIATRAESVASTITGSAAERAGSAISVAEMETDERDYFCQVFRETIQPFLANPNEIRGPLANPGQAQTIFNNLRLRVSPETAPIVDELESLCKEERSLLRQRRLHRFLHAWLLVHVPLSVALLLLGGIHAVIALRY